jgi:hypothetical protein
VYHKKNGKYAANLKDLGVKFPTDRLRLDASRNTFEMSWTDGDKPRYTITHDGRIVK